MTDELDLVRLLRHDADADADAIDRVRRRMVALTDASARTGERAPQPVQIVPYLIYDDVENALEWLTGAFGFRELKEARLVGGGGRIERAEMELGGALISLGRPSIHGDSPTGGVSTMLEVTISGIDAHHQQAKAAGAVIVIELEDAPWGVRRYQARDIEGHNWHFSEPLDRGR